jgi:hypothetical protein
VAIEQGRRHLTSARVVHASEYDTRPPIVEHVKTVTDSAKSGHANPAPIQLWPQPRYVHVDSLRFPNETWSPGARQNAVSAQNQALAFNEDSEQIEFARGHLQLAAFDLSSPSAGVEA